MKKKAAMKMKKAAPAKMGHKKSPAKKPSDLEVGNRKNLPAELKAKISAGCRAWAKRRYKVWPSAYASGAAIKRQKAGKC